MSEHTDDFTAAQDKANRAYDETLRKTGRGTDASAEYQRTMSAEYYNKITIKPSKRVVMTSVNTAAKQITTVDPDWLCHMCGIQQPAWAGDCLTCETLPMMGDRE